VAMRRAAVLAVLLCGCGLTKTIGGPVGPSALARELYPHEIEYELLTQVRGEACAANEELERAERVKSPDPVAVGPGGLYEAAKFDALSGIADADVLLFAQSKVSTRKDGATCVAVSGRAARAQTVRAVGGNVREDRRPLPAETKVRKTRGETLEPGF
jgi:hypothetical protein